MAAKFKVTANIPEWVQAIREKQRPIATAAAAALQETAANAVQEGRDNIASAGRFGGSWLSGLQYRMSGAAAGGEASLEAKVIVFHKKGLAGVFEFGATIQGKPLLWIPTTPGAPPAGRSGKKLVSATIRGRPMLFDAGDRDRARKPLYIGVPSVRIEKKFRIIEIVKQHAARIAELFRKNLKDQ
jgi:Family of unknown function (DUF6441)